ncbi:GroES-like protein [Epithele typhae]|uniref:GroES-like protein n=1 Tax=Epithele typhae TaxID=378194 RepID=UPI00200844C4|nr:GroES-like protein [Epithele typhae]KAH9921197.1 GroES-like protein [Epithele typhae]
MATAKTQKALLLPARAGKYAVGTVPIPTPAPSEVLVKIEAAALNPIDWKIVDSDLFTPIIQSFPYIAGTDGAGVVAEVGAEVTTLAKGDRIVFQGWFANPWATFQEYCVVPAVFAAKLPENISFDEAATVPLGLVTVWSAIYNTDPAAAGKSLLLPPPWEPDGTTLAGKPAFIIGGSSSVGQYAIQVAKLAGCTPIIATASPRNAPLLTALGATHVLDRALPAPALLAALPRLTAGAPVALAYDAVSLPDTQPLAYAALGRAGRLVVVLHDRVPAALKEEDAAAAAAAAEAAGGARARKTIAHAFRNVHEPANRACGAALFAHLGEWLAKGVVKPNKVEVLPGGLAGIPEGLARMEADKVSATKLVCHPSETP